MQVSELSVAITKKKKRNEAPSPEEIIISKKEIKLQTNNYNPVTCVKLGVCIKWANSIQKGASHLDWGVKEEKERVRGTEKLHKDSDIKAGF